MLLQFFHKIFAYETSAAGDQNHVCNYIRTITGILLALNYVVRKVDEWSYGKENWLSLFSRLEPLPEQRSGVVETRIGVIAVRLAGIES